MTQTKCLATLTRLLRV